MDDDCDGHVDELPPISCGLGACAVTVPGCTNGAPVCAQPRKMLLFRKPVIIEMTTATAMWMRANRISSAEQASAGGFWSAAKMDACLYRPDVEPGVEICNGLDDDCDGEIDNGVRCFDFDCALDENDAAFPEAPQGENRPPVIASDTTMYAPEQNVVCGRRPPGLDLGGGGVVGPIGGDRGGGGGIPSFFKPVHCSRTAGIPMASPRLHVDWGDGTRDEPARISCIRDDVNRSVIPHNYTEAGEYDVVLTATDNDGLSSSVELTLRHSAQNGASDRLLNATLRESYSWDLHRVRAVAVRE